MQHYPHDRFLPHRLHQLMNNVMQQPKENISQTPITEIWETSALQEPHNKFSPSLQFDVQCGVIQSKAMRKLKILDKGSYG